MQHPILPFEDVSFAQNEVGQLCSCIVQDFITVTIFSQIPYVVLNTSFLGAFL
jgi:hypothetical protein